LVSGWLQLWA
jgi:hypothetical protein